MRVEEAPLMNGGFEVGEWAIIPAYGIVVVDSVDEKGRIWAWHNPLYWVTPLAYLTT